MRKPHGYATITDPDRGVQEFDTYSCRHCTRSEHVPPHTDPAAIGWLCNGCGQVICRACAAETARLGFCLPWKKKLDMSFARADALRSYGFG